MTLPPITGDWRDFLLAQEYMMPVALPGGRYACIRKMLFTHAIITGSVGDRFCYDDNWCYYDLPSAAVALAVWDGTGEPEGWHRHLPSGRRRDVTADGVVSESVRP